MIKLTEELKKCCENFIAWNNEYKTYWPLSNTIRFSMEVEGEIPCVLTPSIIKKASNTIDFILALKNRTLKIKSFEKIIKIHIDYNFCCDNFYYKPVVLDYNMFVFKFKTNKDEIEIIDVLRNYE